MEQKIPKPGDAIRTRKMQMEGIVEKVSENRLGYTEIFFRISDGDRLMKTPLSNVIIVEKLADEDSEIVEQELNEISNEVLAKYKTAAGKQARDADKKGNFEKGNKRFSGIVKATKKQFANDKKKDVDEGGMGGINRCAPSNDVSYEHVLDEVAERWKKYNEGEEGKEGEEFKKILKKQHQQASPKKKIEELDYNGWKIRYQNVPTKPGGPYMWMAWHGTRNPEFAHRGEAPSAQEALDAAKKWIESGGGAKSVTANKALIDFNREFSKKYAPEGEIFYAKIEDGYLLLSYDPIEGFRKSSPRITGSVVFQCVPISAEEANESHLKANGRYTLGHGEELQPGIMMFPLNFQGTVIHSGDRLHMSEPGFTIATDR